MEGSSEIYKPIGLLFDTPQYNTAVKTCWHLQSYKTQIAMMMAFLDLQKENQIPPHITAEDMIDLLMEESKKTLRERLWEFDIENFDETETKGLLKLVWAVNIINKMKDIELQARMLLKYPEAIPPKFQTPKLLSIFNKYLEILKEKQQETQTSSLLTPQEVGIEVVPRVLQGFWEHPPYPLVNMASQSLSELSTCVTKATLDQVSNTHRAMESKAVFSRSMRDDMVQTIWAEISEKHPDDTALNNTANHATLLATIADVATNHICKLFQPQIPNEPVHHTHAAQCPTRDDLNITGTEEESTSPENTDDMVTPGSLSGSAESASLSEHPSETSSMCEPLIPAINAAESCEDLKTKKKKKGFFQKLFNCLCCFCIRPTTTD